MSKILITKDGFKATEWEASVQDYVAKPIEFIFFELRSSCYIEQGVTLGDIFNAVEAWPELVALLGCYSWCDIEAFHDEAKKPSVELVGLTELELSKSFAIDADGATNFDFHGIGPDENNKIVKNWGLDLTPVNEIKDLPVTLSLNMVIFAEQDGFKEIARCPCSFTLLEVLGEIYFEISCLGSPEERTDKRKELHEMVENIASGKAETRPFSEIMAEMKKTDETIN